MIEDGSNDISREVEKGRGGQMDDRSREGEDGTVSLYNRLDIDM